jgi:hypothetical protein
VRARSQSPMNETMTKGGYDHDYGYVDNPNREGKGLDEW